MTQGRRVKLSANQRTDMWSRWKAGQSLHEIGRAFGKDHVSIQFMLSQHGGIVPAARRRSLLRLTLAEREDISRGIACGSSIRDIAQGRQRVASAVSGEVARHGGRPQYRANEADHQAWESALRPKVCLLAIHVKLQKIVASKLILDWSPEQISGWLSIRERPAEIEDRAIPGHWEGDLLGGSKNSHIATLVERHSRFTTLVKVPSKDTAVVGAALSRPRRKPPASLRRSLTWDCGLEMAKHKTFTVAMNVKVYFCDPQSPWQRGTNENTNGLLRQTFPKRTDLFGYTQADLDKVALRLNQRPRKTLGFETPASRLQASVATTH